MVDVNPRSAALIAVDLTESSASPLNHQLPWASPPRTWRFGIPRPQVVVKTMCARLWRGRRATHGR